MRYVRAFAMTSGEAAPNSKCSRGPWNTMPNKPMAKAISDTEDTAPAAALETISSFPLPLYCATTTVPPVDTAMNTLIRKIFSESIIFTALIAATPEELIIAVFTTFSPTTKAWSTNIGRNNDMI
ncbi:hypothetical protein D3C75_895210 [compost metagenome]